MASTNEKKEEDKKTKITTIRRTIFDFQIIEDFNEPSYGSHSGSAVSDEKRSSAEKISFSESYIKYAPKRHSFSVASRYGIMGKRGVTLSRNRGSAENLTEYGLGYRKMGKSSKLSKFSKSTPDLSVGHFQTDESYALGKNDEEGSKGDALKKDESKKKESGYGKREGTDEMTDSLTNSDDRKHPTSVPAIEKVMSAQPVHQPNGTSTNTDDAIAVTIETTTKTDVETKQKQQQQPEQQFEQEHQQKQEQEQKQQQQQQQQQQHKQQQKHVDLFQIQTKLDSHDDIIKYPITPDAHVTGQVAIRSEIKDSEPSNTPIQELRRKETDAAKESELFTHIETTNKTAPSSQAEPVQRRSIKIDSKLPEAEFEWIG